ncbi:hypothetical protein IC617_08210 [Neiella sp. HB171785]|uniref:Conjugal transfer protein TraE n=1 Tax=Neiella litorisoli TaxID=2771431 RepID=A0A8J6QU33_9GAMM|nr:TraE/TraK family type IV conjugative transfer system protein [Neiella litorisoli]MBD1389407.1 hypothetical protein [Neiella litorisoli]
MSFATQVRESFSQAIASRNIMLLSNFILVVIVLFLFIKTATEDVRVVAIPPVFRSEIELVGDQANSTFKQGWAIHFAQMIGNVSPKNVGFVVDHVTGYLSPRLKKAIESSMTKAALSIQTRRIQRSFVIDDLHHNLNSDIVYVWGQRTTQAPHSKPLVERWTYEFKIASSNGMPRIVHQDNYEGLPQRSEMRSNKVVDDAYLSKDVADVVDANGNTKKGTDQ